MENNVYMPDILNCLANLSSDEVFTPPELANRMLDLLPPELFTNPETTFLDPCTKSGVFLREITKRLLAGLEAWEPDLQRRLDHILTRQVFGIALTQLTADMSRRTLYCTKRADEPKYSVTQAFVQSHNPQGHVLFSRIGHTWDNGKCRFCGASETVFGATARHGLESHAYQFIHTLDPQELFNMTFDVIIGNPPYQMDDGGNGVSAKPIFHLFVQQALKLNPKYLSMIIPARWYAGGKGLDDFRNLMLSDSHIKNLVDFESSKDCFENVNIAGGICYFLRDNSYDGPCEVANMTNGKLVKAKRYLNEFSIFIRSNTALTILHKVLSHAEDTWNNHALARNPFNFQTNFRGRENKKEGDIQILTSKGFQYINRDGVTKNKEFIDHYKILIGRLVPSNGELDVDPKDGYRVITNTQLIGPEQINTETYLDIGVFKTELDALNFDSYLKCKFTRFLLRQAISSLNVTRECFQFVPLQDFTKPWTDAELYEKYGLDEKEIAFIESMIRPMED